MNRISKITTALAILAAIATSTSAHAYTEEDLFPFDGRHLTYPEFEKDLDSISSFIQSMCTYDENKLDADIKDDILRTCSFPNILAELKSQTAKANALFANGDLVTREKAQFIDMDFGWVLHDSFSLDSNAQLPLLNVLLLRTAIQLAMPSISRVWLIQGGRGSIDGRFYILPKFAAGVERDLLLTRTLQYTREILCLERDHDVEEPCIERRSALAQGVNSFLKEYQAKRLVLPDELNSFYQLSYNFRLLYQAFIKTHENPIQVLAAIKSPDDDYKALSLQYGALIDLPKRIRASEINTLVSRLNVQRYVNEQRPIELGYPNYLKTHEISLTPEIIQILATIRKQLNLYYTN